MAATNMHRHLGRQIAAATVLSTTACQTYARAAPAELAPGRVVRIELSDAGRQAVTYQLGPRVALLEGSVSRRAGDTLLVHVTQLTRVGASEERWSGDTIRLTSDATSSTLLRRTSKTKSVLLAGAIVGGAALVAGAFGATDLVGRGIFGGSGSSK